MLVERRQRCLAGGGGWHGPAGRAEAARRCVLVVLRAFGLECSKQRLKTEVAPFGCGQAPLEKLFVLTAGIMSSLIIMILLRSRRLR